MVQTRRGTRTHRIEDYAERLRNYREQHESTLNDIQDEIDFSPDYHMHERRYHIGHSHPHPGPYRDLDEHHRHRKPDTVPKTEIVHTYKRRKHL